MSLPINIWKRITDKSIRELLYHFMIEKDTYKNAGKALFSHGGD